MNKVNMSEEQRALVVLFRDSFTERPSPEEYDKFQQRMKKLGPDKKPKQKEIPHTLPGYESNELKLTDDFDALQDLPVGWAVTSLYDSGGNHRIELAGCTVLRRMWNNWEGKT